MRKIDMKEILEQVNRYYKEHKRIDKLEDMGIIHDRKSLDYRSKIDYKLNSFSELLRKCGYRLNNDILINGEYKEIKSLSIEDMGIIINEFINKNGRSPKVDDFNSENNLPSYSSFQKMLENNNITKSDFYELNNIVDKNKKKFCVNDYDIEINKIKKYICNHGIPKSSELSSLGFHDCRWLIRHTNNKKVKDYNTFLEFELNESPRFLMTKDKATEIIFKCFNDLGKSPTKTELKPYICDSVVKRLWGSINNMKRELGLDILGDNNREKHIGFEELKSILLNVCNDLIKSDTNKKYITTKDITDNSPVVFQTFERIFKQNNLTVRRFLEENGFNYQKCGSGYVYNFGDGEITKSQFEYEFSKYIKELGYTYNKDYYRDVRYRAFINNYNGLLDCDYEIHINNRIVYIEIAGLLRDYKAKYKTPALITSSKSKRKYAEKLNIKEQMFIDNNLEYYILFPSDLKDLDELFNNVLKIGKKGNDD